MTEDTGSLSWGAYQQAQYDAQKAKQQLQRDQQRALNPKSPRSKMTPEQQREANRESMRRYKERERRERQAQGTYIPPNSQKTHCPAGHRYDEENTRYEKDGSRKCRACARSGVQRYDQANKEKIQAYRSSPRYKDRANGQRRQKRAADPEGVRAVDRARYQASPEPKRRGIYRGRHGLSPGEWDDLWNQQVGCCYLCGDKLPEPSEALMKSSGSAGRPHLDHDHRCCPAHKSCSACRRGIACSSCNYLIGHAKDDPERLRRVADELEKALEAVNIRMAAKENEWKT